MHSKVILLVVFIVVAIAQLYVPASMIIERNDILETGREYRFKTAPIDPNDPFRGKYVWLNFSDDAFDVTDTTVAWIAGETVFAVLVEDSIGMAQVKSIHREKPEGTDSYLKTTVRYVSENHVRVHLEYPFDRFYMEESKALPAEQAYDEASSNDESVAYALVNIKNGEAVLKDVHIDGVSIREIVKQTLKQEGIEN